MTWLRISPDGGTLLSMSTETRIWDISTRKERRRFEPHLGYWALAVTHDCTTAALVNMDNSIRLLDLATGKERQGPPASSEMVVAAAFTPDART